MYALCRHPVNGTGLSGSAGIGGFRDAWRMDFFWAQDWWQGLNNLATCGSGSASGCVVGDSLAVFVVGNEGFSMGAFLLCAVVLGLDSPGRVQKVVSFVCRSDHSFRHDLGYRRSSMLNHSSLWSNADVALSPVPSVGLCLCLGLFGLLRAQEDALCNHNHSKKRQ